MKKYLIAALCLMSAPAMANTFQLTTHFAHISQALNSGVVSYSNPPLGYSTDSDIVGSMIAVGAELTEIRYTKTESGACFVGLTFKKAGKKVLDQPLWVGEMSKVGQSKGLCDIGHTVTAD